MISDAVLTAMLPEHLLLLGIVLVLGLEIAGRGQRASLGVAVLAVAGPWMLSSLVEFLQRSLQAIPTVVG